MKYDIGTFRHNAGKSRCYFPVLNAIWVYINTNNDIISVYLHAFNESSVIIVLNFPTEINFD